MNTRWQRWREKRGKPQDRNPALRYGPFTCGFCGAVFMAKKADRSSFCSREHAFAAKRAKADERARLAAQTRAHARQRVCVGCGASFDGAPAAKWCSERCHYRATKGRPDTLRTCGGCGAQFTDTSKQGRPRLFCSPRCTLVHNRLNRRHRQRAAEAVGENVRAHEVYARDGWHCKLCNKRVDKALSYPHPLSASLDHIVPLSKGGKHEARNVQLAHLRCNIEKGARGGGQLLLIG